MNPLAAALIVKLFTMREDLLVTDAQAVLEPTEQRLILTATIQPLIVTLLHKLSA